MGDVLDSAADVNGDVSLPPHHRYASHTLNLISCTDMDKWLLSKMETKIIYSSATTKCAGLWNNASRSTVASEIMNYVIAKKLVVPCSTKWNSFYNALARIFEIPTIKLNTISSRLQLKCISERECLFLKEYCIVMKPCGTGLTARSGQLLL